MVCSGYSVFFLAISLILWGSFSEAQGLLQDVVYGKDGLFKGTIEMLDDQVSVKGTNGEQTLSLRENLYLGVKSDGSFISFYDPASNWVENTTYDVHKLITRDGQIFPADYAEVLGNKVGFQDHYSGRYISLPCEQFVMIIYKTGIHKLLADPQDAARYLAGIKSINHFSRPETERTIELSPEEQQYFSTRALRKTEALSLYLTIISDKNADVLDQDKAIEEALRLFVDEDRLVEVSSLNREQNVTYKIEGYLNNLRMLPYTKIELLWNQIQYINKIRPGTDGNYYGTVTVEQVFRGYNKENEVVYEDFTVKAIEIVIKPYNMIVEGDSIPKLDVFLSDIGVKQTEQL